jgi:hypothetical protein
MLIFLNRIILKRIFALCFGPTWLAGRQTFPHKCAIAKLLERGLRKSVNRSEEHNVMHCQILVGVRKVEFSSVIQGASKENTAYVTAVTFKPVVSFEAFFASGCSK